MLIKQYSFLINTRLSLLDALVNVSRDNRNAFIDEMMQLIDKVIGLYSVSGRNKIREEYANKKNKEGLQVAAVMDVIKSGKGIASDYSTVLAELNKSIHKLDSSFNNINKESQGV